MNIKELIGAFRVDSDDLVAEYISKDADVKRWLNEAQEEACTRKDLLFASDEPICEVTVGPSERRAKISDRWVYLTHAILADAVDPTRMRQLHLTSRAQLDLDRRDWRRHDCDPYALITYDASVEVVGKLEQEWTVLLEGWRLPLKPMDGPEDKPEIGGIHHRYLVHWALHRHYAVPDREIFNPDKSAKALTEFERYFGRRPDADLRRDQQADQPHHNQAW